MGCANYKLFQSDGILKSVTQNMFSHCTDMYVCFRFCRTNILFVALKYVFEQFDEYRLSHESACLRECLYILVVLVYLTTLFQHLRLYSVDF
jgi:hypothetical protein